MEQITLDRSEHERLKAIEDACRYALSQEGDDICWRDLYDKLGELLGMDFKPKLFADKKWMKANCNRFIDSIYDGPYVPVYIRKNE